TAKATLDMFSNLRVDSGGFKRNNNSLTDAYDYNEWILVDMRISNALRRGGRAAEADGYVAQLVQKASANYYLMPELFNDDKTRKIGDYAGQIPMVGYGAGAYVLTMLDRSGKIEPNDCADGKAHSLPALQCNSINTNPGGGPGGGGPGGAGGGGAGGSG